MAKNLFTPFNPLYLYKYLPPSFNLHHKNPKFVPVVCLGMAEGVVANQDPNILDELDIDCLLQGFGDEPIFDLDVDLFPDPPLDEFQSSDSASPVSPAALDAPPIECASPDSVSSFVNYVEKILMDDDDSGDGEEFGDFFSGVLVDGFDSRKSEVDTPEACDASAEETHGKEKEVIAVASVEEKDDDFLSQKRRRQMRNRESAMLSRERKKMYVRELEVKSKYLESECRHLDYALRCCMAENMALRQGLQFQKERHCGASVAKQESAVLFMESLLLGSLFWFVGIVCLFLVPRLRSPNQVFCRLLRGPSMVVAGILSVRNDKLGPDIKLKFLRLRRRCRGLRSRMKFIQFPIHSVPV